MMNEVDALPTEYRGNPARFSSGFHHAIVNLQGCFVRLGRAPQCWTIDISPRFFPSRYSCSQSLEDLAVASAGHEPLCFLGEIWRCQKRYALLCVRARACPQFLSGQSLVTRSHAIFSSATEAVIGEPSLTTQVLSASPPLLPSACW